jgi:hypothetical protein
MAIASVRGCDALRSEGRAGGTPDPSGRERDAVVCPPFGRTGDVVQLRARPPARRQPRRRPAQGVAAGRARSSRWHAGDVVQPWAHRRPCALTATWTDRQ